MNPVLAVEGLAKGFTLHQQGGVELSVLDGVSLALGRGECVVLDGPSGAGKSTLLRCVYGNYRPRAGSVLVRHRGRQVDMARTEPRKVLEVRRYTLGYVSQFLRAVPRVPALDVVAEPLRAMGVPAPAARERAAEQLAALNVPERLWGLAPATFSGGEQQRVNIARGLAADYPVLLLDEPTASLDPANAAAVLALIRAAVTRGAAVLGIFHDPAVRAAVATRRFPMPATTRAEARP